MEPRRSLLGASVDQTDARKASRLSRQLPPFGHPHVTADYDAERRILEIVCLNCKLEGATLIPKMRKLFDVLAEGLASEKSRGDRTAIELFLAGLRTWGKGLIALV